MGGAGGAGSEEESPSAAEKRSPLRIPSVEIVPVVMPVLWESISLDTRDQSDEEAKGPEVHDTPFKLFSGENKLNRRLCVKVRAYMLSK